jgi:hypothetical protein
MTSGARRPLDNSALAWRARCCPDRRRHGRVRARLPVGKTGQVTSPADLDRLFEPFRWLGGQRARHAGAERMLEER